MSPPSPRATTGTLRRALPLAIALFLGAAALFAVFRGGRNIAVGRPITASSVRLGDPRGLVNGFVEYGGYALHTKTETPAWVRVDLESSRSIAEIRIYSRGDGYLDVRDAQLAIDVSEDGVTYRRAGRCTEVFSQLSPCVVDARDGAPALRGRYVLVTRSGALVLSEIEVIEAP